MKKALLSLSLLLGIAGGAAAQSPCVLTVTKSGAGATRTYTASSTASGSSFNIRALNSLTGVTLGTTTTNTLTVTYAAGGYYHIFAGSHTSSCNDSLLLIDTVAVPGNVPNHLNVAVILDTTIGGAGGPGYIPIVKIWLIKQDATAGTLTAVDSAFATVNISCMCVANATYANMLPGNYRVKAYITNQPASASVHTLPTYGDTAVYWSAANTFNVTLNNTSNKYIKLRTGTPTTGPGFVGGLISAGANKGTAEGDPVGGITIFLRNAAGKVVQMATTGADGTFAFNNLAAGTYTVYPEELNFKTFASDAIHVTTTQSRMAVNFKRNETGKEYVPGAVLGVGTIEPLTYSVSPNPATDKLQINLGSAAGKVTATLSNTTGQVVMQEVFSGANATLSVSQLPAGMYLLQLQSGKEIHTEKVQIQR